MRALVLAASLAGGACGFSPAATPSDGAPHGGPDAPGATRADSGAGTDGAPIPGDGAISAASCFAPDTTGLVLCLELDDANLSGPGPVTARDGSPKKHDATVTNGDPVQRTVPSDSPAQQISSLDGLTQVTIQTADSPDFYVQNLTLMAWVDRIATPAINNTYGLIEKSGQFVMEVDAGGNLECLIQSTTSVISGATLALPGLEWVLTACTYDGAQICAYVMTGSDGDGQTTCQNAVLTLNTSADYGVVVGARYSTASGIFNHLYGSIDSARIFNRALTQQEICVGGGRTGC